MGLVLPRLFSVQVARQGATLNFTPDCMRPRSGWQHNARVQARALRNGQIFHASGPVRWGRDVAMKLMGEKLLDMPWLYGQSQSL